MAEIGLGGHDGEGLTSDLAIQEQSALGRARQLEAMPGAAALGFDKGPRPTDWVIG